MKLFYKQKKNSHQDNDTLINMKKHVTKSRYELKAAQKPLSNRLIYNYFMWNSFVNEFLILDSFVLNRVIILHFFLMKYSKKCKFLIK